MRAGKEEDRAEVTGGRGHVHKSLSLELEDSSLQVNRSMQKEGKMGVYIKSLVK